MRRDSKYSRKELKEPRSHKGYERGFHQPARSKRLLLENEEPPVGAHLVTPRRGFTHHGIYVGRDKVVHYKSVLRQFRRGPVEEISLECFAHGRAIWIQIHSSPRFDASEVVRRARSRVGEDCYRLFTNNCEHFCEWCLQDEERSYQIDRMLRLPRWFARFCRDAPTRRLPAVAGAFD